MGSKKTCVYIVTQRQHTEGTDEFRFVKSLDDVELSVCYALVYTAPVKKNQSVNDILRLSMFHSMSPDLKFFFITPNANSNPMFNALFMGLNGCISYNRKVLMNLETLRYLVTTEVDKNILLASSENKDLVSLHKRISEVQSADVEKRVEYVSSSRWLDVVNKSLKGIESSLSLSRVASTEMVRHFQEAYKILDKLKLELAGVNEDSRKIQIALDKLQSAGHGRGLETFVAYNVPDRKRVVYIREYSHCQYLGSFLCTYVDVMKHNNKNIKLLFVLPNSTFVTSRYESIELLNGVNMTRLSPDSIAFVDGGVISRSSYYWTVEPSKSIIDKFLSFEDATDGFIVLDRTLGKFEMRGRSLNYFHAMYAVNSVRDISTFQLKENLTFVPNVMIPGAFGIPTIEENLSDKDARQKMALYMNVYNHKDVNLIKNFTNVMFSDYSL